MASIVLKVLHNRIRILVLLGVMEMSWASLIPAALALALLDSIVLWALRIRLSSAVEMRLCIVLRDPLLRFRFPMAGALVLCHLLRQLEARSSSQILTTFALMERNPLFSSFHVVSTIVLSSLTPQTTPTVLMVILVSIRAILSTP